MSIWFKETDLATVRKMEHGNILEQLGIEILEIGPDFVKGKDTTG